MSNSRSLHPEDQIAQYRVVGPLGAGGMGEVYLAQDQSLERSVALKVLPYELTRSDDRVRRFVQEAKSASSLNHPNIVTIYEIGQEPVKSATGGGDSGPLHYISMELISGKTLGAKIHEEKTDLKTLVGYLAQAAEGIAKAHAVGIVHRDLKPGNIMVSDDGYAKVLDFGLAKLTEKTSGPNEATEIADRTSDGAVMGTVSYMSPEQVQGKPVDARSDIFSFGSIIYEAATRQRPFVAESNVEIMHKILNEKPRPVEEINPHVPAELRRVIRRCLAKQPEQRAQSMKDIAIELREIFDEYDSLSSSATSATLTASGLAAIKRRKKTNVAAVAGITAVVAAAVAFGWWGMMHGNKGEGDQPFQTARFTTQTNRGDVTASALSPDGRYIAYVAGPANKNTLRVRQVATGSDVEILPVQDAIIEFPGFTPDGNYIYYCKRKADAPNYRVLMSVPSLGGAEQERGFDVDTRLAFSPDGKRACFGRNYPQNGYWVLVMRDLATGKDREFIKLPQPGGLGGAPSWSTDGKFIAISVISPPPKGSTTVALINPETGERRDFFTRAGAFLADLTWLPDNSGLMMAGPEIGSALTNQLYLLSYPGAKLRRVSNDFNTYADITAGGHDVAIASMRSSVLANLYAIDAVSGQSSMITSTGSPENSPFNLVTVAGRVYYSKLHGDYLGVGSIPVTGGPETSYDTGEGHCVSIKGGENVLVVQRLDLDQQMHLWRMAPGGGMKQLTSGGGEDLLDVAPDGKWFTYGDIDSIKGIWIMSTDGGPGRLLAPNAQKVLGGFSHDSKFIITLEFSSDEQGLIQNQFKVVSIDGSAPPIELKFPPRAADQENRVGTDTVTYIDGNDPNRNLFGLDLKSGKTSQLTHLTDGAITDHEWSPDGQRLAVVRRLPDGENVWFLNTDGSQPRLTTHLAGQDIIQLLWADNTRLIVDAGQHSNDVVLVRDAK